jgi:hypothetical protein
MATNITPGYDLTVVSVKLTGVRGPEFWHDVTSIMPGFASVAGATLRSRTPVEVVTLERGPLPPRSQEEADGDT